MSPLLCLPGGAPARLPPSPARRRLTRLARAAACVLNLVAAGAHAQAPDLARLSLEDLLDVEIVTASRFQQRVAEAPSVVQVITAEDIRTHGWRTLGEALDSLPGLYVSDTGLYTYLGARGLLRAGDYNTRFLLLVNGHRLNDPVYSQSPIGAEFPLDLSLVERIEYAPGPGSAVYGSNAFFGVINVLTRAPATFGHGELRAAAGNHGTTDLQLTVPVRTAAGDTLLSARAFDTQGRTLRFPAFADTPSGGVVRDQDGERARQVFVQHTRDRLSLQLVAGDRRKEDPVAPYQQTFAEPGAQVQDRWIAFGATLDGTLGDRVDASARLDAIDYRYVGDYVYGGAPTYLNRDIASGVAFVASGHLVARLGARHTLVGGIEVQQDHGVVQRNFDVAPYASYLEARHDMTSWGVFVDDEFRFADAWRVNAGLRADRSDRGVVRLSPRLALIGEPQGGGLVKLIVGQSYRSPNAYERYYQVESEEGAQRANPALGAEHVQTAELFYSRGVGARGRAELGVYHYRLHDLITLLATDDGALTMSNAGHARSRGAELAYVYQGDRGLRLRASYAYSEVADSEAARPLNAPHGIARVSAAVPLAEGWRLGMSAQRMGGRVSREGRLPAYTRLDAHLVWDVPARPLAWSLGVRNLLDQAYADPVGPEFLQDTVPRRGRELWLQARWRW
jgi:iron complex outermembrane receptor protein